MKKVLATGLIIFALINILAISAFAASGVPEGGTAPNWTYTATLDGNDPNTLTTIQSGQMFLLIVIKTSALNAGGFPASLTADAILYIDQATATADNQTSNSIAFPSFIPMNYSGGKAFISGGTLAAPVAVGTLASHGILGDANGDTRVNVADITALRDHILSRTLLTGTKLVMADVNNDARVNVADITKIRDFILGRISSLS